MADDRKRLGVFEVLYIIMLAVLLVLAVFHMGKPRVGVIDLGRVAHEVGVEQKIIEAAQDWRDEAQSDLQKLKDELAIVGKGIQTKAESATEQEKLDLRKSMNEATREYYEGTAKVRVRVSRQQQAVLQTFRTRVEPFITEVARKRRVWLVLDRSARLVYATAQIDITDEVIERAAPFFAEHPALLDDELIENDMPEAMPEDVPEPADGEEARE